MKVKVLDEVNYECAALDDNILRVSNNSIEVLPSREQSILNITIKFLENNLIEVVGEEEQFDFNINMVATKVTKKEAERIEEEDLIRTKSLFGKPIVKVKSGWYSLKERKPFKLISNGLTIIFEDNKE